MVPVSHSDPVQGRWLWYNSGFCIILHCMIGIPEVEMVESILFKLQCRDHCLLSLVLSPDVQSVSPHSSPPPTSTFSQSHSFLFLTARSSRRQSLGTPHWTFSLYIKVPEWTDLWNNKKGNVMCINKGSLYIKRLCGPPVTPLWIFLGLKPLEVWNINTSKSVLFLERAPRKKKKNIWKERGLKSVSNYTVAEGPYFKRGKKSNKNMPVPPPPHPHMHKESNLPDKVQTNQLWQSVCYTALKCLSCFFPSEHYI